MSQSLINALLPELKQLEFIIDSAGDYLDTQTIAYLNYQEHKLPIYAISLGAKSESAPVINFIGGVHGLERIGTQVVLAYLETLVGRLAWDQSLIDLLSKLRINFVPLVNPVGMAQHWRANGNHVDLMRNAPVDSLERTAFLVGGHRLSKRIPWYRGEESAPMQEESQALCDFIRQACFSSPFSLVLDCHSGFGIHDRVWFPYAKSRLQPISHIGELYHLRELFLQTYPHQSYIIEPQAKHYLCNGDLWDYMYDESLSYDTTFLPLTLEMGSWRWVKKNPLQLLKSLGLYHPMKPHRVKRVLRGHLILMDFLTRATASHANWLSDCHSLNMAQKATALWYDN